MKTRKKNRCLLQIRVVYTQWCSSGTVHCQLAVDVGLTL